MKKIFAVVITSVLLISTTFAFGLGAGAKGTLGMNFGANDSIAESFQNITKDTAFDAGGGVYDCVGVRRGAGGEEDCLSLIPAFRVFLYGAVFRFPPIVGEGNLGHLLGNQVPELGQSLVDYQQIKIGSADGGQKVLLRKQGVQHGHGDFCGKDAKSVTAPFIRV